MKNGIEILGTVVGTIAAILFLSFLLSWPVMALWNGCLVGAVEGVKEIGWLQAWGLQFMLNLMFKTKTSTKEN
tara:strand:+ start:45 stop:263 length:219 start_codon:yes stop_codon:yes gene_type:complete